MYGVNVIDDARRVIRATLTNQVAKFAPNLYVRLTGETGRGEEPESVQEIASYFQTCFEDYFNVLGIRPAEVPAYVHGKSVLEYGPGDVPGVALLMLAYGAQQVFCVDRFSMVQLTPTNIAVLHRLIDTLPDWARKNADDCFHAPGSRLVVSGRNGCATSSSQREFLSCGKPQIS